jgi:hypothetical protein
MNIIHLCGGLGNQIFQYSFGKAQENNGIKVTFDVSWYNKRTRRVPRLYMLDKFQTKVDKIDRMIQPVVKENGFDHSLLKKDNHNFAGYWQYVGYYENIKSLLNQQLVVKEIYYTEDYLKLRQAMIGKDIISIHVRRTDYLGDHGFGVLSLGYYLEALAHLQGDVYIFSDDIGWCRHYFKKEYFSRKLTFIHLPEYLDFELMRLCTHNIIANSTFSWWAAFLNNNPGKKVIAPSGWLLEKKEDDDLYYPKDWLKI